MNAFAMNADSSKGNNFSFGSPKERTVSVKKAEKEPVVVKSLGYELKSDNPRYASISADFLYWEYSYTDNVAGFEIDASPFHYKRLNNDWMPGGRLNFTISNLYDWNIGMTGTYLHGSKKTVIPEVLKIPFILPTNGTVNGSNSVTFGEADLEFSSKLFLRKSISIQPLFAASGAYIKRTTVYDQTFVNGVHYMNTYPIRFTGYGPKVGSYLNLKFGNSGCEFFAGIFGSMYYGHSKVNIQIQNLDTNSLTRYVDKIHDLKVNMQLQLGFHYQYYFSNSCAFGLKACWETNYWWNFGDQIQFAFLDILADSAADNLAFHGFNVGINFDF
jgi:hypothetical protein